MSSSDEQPVEVQAEVIEDKGLAVSFTPAAIEANFAALDARVEEMIEGYAEARYDLTDADSINTQPSISRPFSVCPSNIQPPMAENTASSHISREASVGCVYF